MKSTSDQVPNPVVTDAECLAKIETVEAIISAAVQDEMKSTSDQVPNLVVTDAESTGFDT